MRYWPLGVLLLAAAVHAALQSGPTTVQHFACGGPATIHPGPASIGGCVTATTLPSLAAPSWVPNTLAAWMLDEPSGTRVNLQGTTARDLSVIDTSDPGSSTDHIEGTASFQEASAQSRHTSDTFPTLISPVSVGCWVKWTQAGKIVMHDWQGTIGTVQLLVQGSTFEVDAYDTTAVVHRAISAASYPTGAWHHVVGTMVSGGNVTLYVDSVQAAQVAMATAAARAGPLYVGDNIAFLGLIDECFVASLNLSPASVCRICSCGIRGEQCTCNGTAFVSTGRNATSCSSCTLPADCTAAPS